MNNFEFDFSYCCGFLYRKNIFYIKFKGMCFVRPTLRKFNWKTATDVGFTI